jgi:hypothetical protein
MSIVVVSGHRRSGNEGGLSVLFDENLQGRESEPDENGYAPNHPSGLFEVGYYNQLKPQFLRAVRDRQPICALKITWDCLVYLPKGEWIIIFMDRSAEEIDASCAKVDDYIRDHGSAKMNDQRNNQLKKISKTLPFSCFRRYSHDDVEHVLGIMGERRDVELLRVNYQDVINNPEKVFSDLKYTPLDKERIPIDAKMSASVIDKNLYRVRK